MSLHSTTANFVNRTNIAQTILICLDLILTLFAEDQRHSVFFAISLYFLQFILLIAMTVTFFVRVGNTYPLRIGLAGVVFSEFGMVLWGTGIYFLAFITARATFVVSFDKSP